MESISSMKIIALPIFRAVLKRSRTRLAPTPTNISMKSEPVTERKGTPASPATARAISVLPVPGGPTRRIPLGIRAPISANRSGCLRKSMTSVTSCLTPSYPATSAKVVAGRSEEYVLALLLPIDMIPPICPDARRCIHMKKPMSRRTGRRRGIRVPQMLWEGEEYLTPFSVKRA